MKIYPDTKVYILCPGNFHTGGVELLHQLCSQLTSLNVKAYMFYLQIADDFNKMNPVDNFYKKYHLNYTDKIIDDKHNILIVYECATDYLYKFKNIRCILWWLSVDNYLSCLSNFIRGFTNIALYVPMQKFFYFDKNDTNIEHWVQSEYARQFISLNGIPNERIFFVEDYINQAFFNEASSIDISKKENVVAFNPQKGLDVTKKLIALAPDINWQPIQNMTPKQVQQLLARTKVYIDFGNHPGKDRIPREAAISGCVVITGKRGSAANNIDVNIPAEFKFDEKTNRYNDIINKIREVFQDFEVAHLKQENYRKKIMNDKARFTKEVAAAFEILPPPLRYCNLLHSWRY